jgi:hypothetical protein
VTGVFTAPWQAAYGAGQVDCWLLQRRGETRLLQNELGLQLEQSAPPEPHAPFEKPVAHVPSARQQPAQFDALHPLEHTRFWQVSFLSVQSSQVLPPTGPHASFEVPTTHVLPSQHPFGHVDGPHVDT